MSVPIAYLTVVLVWSTTPLGITWSSESISPTMAVLLRMAIAAALGAILLGIFKIQLPKTRQALKLYAYSSVGVFGGMLFSYLSASYISSGMISLVFGLSPIISGLLAQKILGDRKFNTLRKLAMTIAFSGLFLAFYHSVSLTGNSWPGICFILLAVLSFSLSSVLVKSVHINIHPAATTQGTLLFSLPLFFLAWWLVDGSIAIDTWQQKSVMAIVYLVVFGSMIGFVAYFYVLQKLKASTVSLITMVTPIIAIILGATLNNEPITNDLIYGAICVVIGLGLYQWSNKFPRHDVVAV